MQDAIIAIEDFDVEVNVIGKGKEKVNLSLIQEAGTGLFFAVDASYLEQEVDVVRSPYGNGTMVFAEGDDGAEMQADCIREKIENDGGAEHPIYTKKKWLSQVNADKTLHGYWEWVSHKLTSSKQFNDR